MQENEMNQEIESSNAMSSSTDSGENLPTNGSARQVDEDFPLPNGWEKFNDEQGVYFWHKRTGTVTRDRPALILDSPTSTISSSSSMENCFESNSLLYNSDSIMSIETKSTTPLDEHRFDVRSLGWTMIDEEDLTTERSSKAVNRCIHDLTRGINDGIGRWGEGKNLYMDINQYDLMLIDPVEMTILHKQSIASIRVWGVGRENSRDFAYVAKDKDRNSKIYKCHVFRSENVSARVIANTLREICRNLMIQRGLLNESGDISPRIATTLNRNSNISFPSANEESRTSLPAIYLGCVYVDRPGGMEVLRAAIEKVAQTVPQEKWISVFLYVSPTSFSVVSNSDNETLFDCRIRYLSFLGVGNDSTFCGTIIHCADNSFKCHVFHCQPSTIQLCKTIEAACKLRYQKCLDAHPQAAKPAEPTKTYGAQIRNFVENWWFGNKQNS